jgi:hypothetical protein
MGWLDEGRTDFANTPDGRPSNNPASAESRRETERLRNNPFIRARALAGAAIGTSRYAQSYADAVNGAYRAVTGSPAATAAVETAARAVTPPPGNRTWRAPDRARSEK